MPKLYNTRAIYWCFTINNYGRGREFNIFNARVMKYVIVGKEVSTNGTRHLQGFVCFRDRKRLAGAKKVFPRAHFEIMKGTVAQAIEYCKKDGSWKEWGVKPKTESQRQIDYWSMAYELAKTRNLEAIPKQMLIRYYGAFKRIGQDNPYKPKDLEVLDNIWVVGPTGYGKSTWVREAYPIYYDKPANKWWDGYRGEPTILCDDFGPQEFKYLGYRMKRWADRFSFHAENKGGGEDIRPVRIAVTSQYTIGECFEDPLIEAAISRRFRVVHLEHWQTRANIDQLIVEHEVLDSDSAELDEM